MDGPHYDDFELLAYLEANGDLVDVAEIGRHLSTCTACGERLNDVKSFSGVLSDESVWQAVRQRLRGPRLRLIRDAAARVVNGPIEERAAATFEALMRCRIEAWPEYLKERPTDRSAALVQRIVAEARKELDNRPKQSLALLEVARGVANTLPDVFELAEQRGSIAKERANALRMLGRYPEALEELDWAQRYLSHLPAPSFDLLFVDWARASVLFYMTEYAEALPLARVTAKAFRQFSEVEYANQVENLVANILCEQGDVAEARKIYMRLLRFFEADANEEMVARLHANLAECAVRLDQPEEGRMLAEEAMSRYDRLGMPVEKIRVRWTLGYSLMRQGRDDDALEALQTATADFERAGMVGAAAGAGLDVAELHIHHKRWALAERIARRLVTVFTEANAPLHQTQALAYLAEVVSRNRDAAQLLPLLEYVRTYVQDERTIPADFSPPS